MTCRLCSGATESFAHAVVLGRHPASYSRCAVCEYVQVEDPHWLPESYSDAIVATDTGAVERNLLFAAGAPTVFRLLAGRGPCLDWAGGAGLFVRLMRDRGFDVRWSDGHCKNVYALGWEDDPALTYRLTTAFEVVEHLLHPLDDLAALAKRSDNLWITTQLLPAARPPPGQWWYYALETGQHIGFLTYASLQLVARRLGLHLASNRRNSHLLTRRPLARPLGRLLAEPRLAALVAPIFRGRSLRDPDRLAQLARRTSP